MKLRRFTICGNIPAVFALARFNALGDFRLRIIHRSVKEISFNREHKQRYHSGCHNANADTLFNALSRDIGIFNFICAAASAYVLSLLIDGVRCAFEHTSATSRDFLEECRSPRRFSHEEHGSWFLPVVSVR